MTQHEQTADGAQDGSTEVAGEGPPDGLPDAVPDFVGEIHTTINDFLGGGVEHLGDAISGIASNGGGGEAAAMVADVAMVLPV